ncbi:MAG: hypothetical protein DRI23_07020 [Candidatus Cloacimonadota bacterium]|nr:MAG: hypothetical protein DRI23_07020 [Candidatus Cloacimonadota bacterium]
MGKIFSKPKKRYVRRKRTGSSRYFFYFILALSVIFGLVWGIRTIFTKLSMFEIDHIVIKGNENLETEFLENLAQDFMGLNLYATSKKDILQKYENITRIKDISVGRIFPNKIKIGIQERLGKFFVKTLEGEIFPIDVERIVLDNDTFYANENLPIIDIADSTKNIVVGRNIRNDFVEEIFRFCDEVHLYYPEFINNISEFYRANGELYIVEANTGYKIVFGSDELSDKIKRFKFLEQNRTFEKGKIIDLRYKNQLVIRSEEE